MTTLNFIQPDAEPLDEVIFTLTRTRPRACSRSAAASSSAC